jgi:hypothetical protein
MVDPGTSSATTHETMPHAELALIAAGTLAGDGAE